MPNPTNPRLRANATTTDYTTTKSYKEELRATYQPTTSAQRLFTQASTPIQTSRQQQAVAAEEAMQRTLDDLLEFMDFPPDWDSYNSKQPSSDAIFIAADLLITAHKALGKLIGERIEPQLITPIPNGGIEIDWGSRHTKLIIHVSPSGTLDYAYIDRQGGKHAAEEIHNTSAEKVLQMIAKVLFSA